MPRRPSVSKDQVQSHPALAGGHVILLSPENPAFPEAATFQGADAMQQSLENQGLEYEPTRGKYGKPESSFIVHVNDPAHIEAALGMAKRFGQESVVYSTGGKHQLVWTNGPHEGQATPPSEGHDFYDAEPEDNYTMIPGPNGEPHGFMAYHLNLNDPPAPFSPGSSPVTPPEAARAVVKAAVEVYHDILLGLRMRELAKAEEKAAARGPQVPTEKTMKLTDLIKSQVAKAPKANGGAITVGKKELSEESTRPDPRDAKDDEGLVDPMDTEKGEFPTSNKFSNKLADIKAQKAEVNVNKGNLKANGGRISRHSIWKKAEVASAPEANGGTITVGKAEIPAGNKKANGGTITLGKQEWVIDLKHTGHDEKRVIEQDPVKGAKGFEEPKKQDRPEESSATGGAIKANEPKKGPAQGNKAAEVLKEQSAPGGKQEGAVSVKGKGDAKGGGTDIFDSVKGKRNPAKDPVIEKAEDSGREESSRGEWTSDDEKDCPACGGKARLGGVLGDRKHFNCDGCGMWFSHKPGDVEKAEGMKVPKAPGATHSGSPSVGGGGFRMSEKQDISGVPSAPSAGPAGNTAITNVDTTTKSEPQTLILGSLKKALGEFGRQDTSFGRQPLPGTPAKDVAAGKTGVAAKMATAGLSKPMGVPAATAKPAAMTPPVKASPFQGLGSAMASLDKPMKLKTPVPVAAPAPTAKKEVVSAPPANGGKVTVAKEEKRPHYNSWKEAAEANGKRVIGQDHRAKAGKPSAEHVLFEESDPKVLHPSDKKKMKKEELCKGCGKMHLGKCG